MYDAVRQVHAECQQGAQVTIEIERLRSERGNAPVAQAKPDREVGGWAHAKKCPLSVQGKIDAIGMH